MAPAWEAYRGRLFENVRSVSEWLVDQVDPQPGQTVLELTAGPGETGFLAAARLGPGGHLISSDFVPARQVIRRSEAGSVVGLASTCGQQHTAGSDDRRAYWDAWWDQVAQEPALQHAVTERRAVFETTYPTEELSPPADWHTAALTAAGFAEAGLVWRSGPAAVIAAAP